MANVVFVVMDGVGIGKHDVGDAVYQANTPNLDRLKETCLYTKLKAHGTAVGLPSDDDMGNSEVGHNAIGCGQIYSQGAKLVSESIADKSIFNGKAWKEIQLKCAAGSTLHLLGLLSDGNVHSNIAHLFSIIEQAKKDGIHRVRIHILLDGRDVPATSALEYVRSLESFLKMLNGSAFDYAIASGGGRMQITMDRYEADWDMVKKGWDTHVYGIGRQFASAEEAIVTYRSELECIDQDLPPFVITHDNEPIGCIHNNDCVLLFNFRGDRAIEISQAFDNDDFQKFDRGSLKSVYFVGMLEYDSDLHIPKNYLLEPQKIQYTLTDILCSNNIREFAVSETQKYGHVTYFWNGNRSQKFSEELETYEEIPSDIIPFDQKPEMKAKAIADSVIMAIQKNTYGFIRCNFPNGDMVGHTGNFQAAVNAVETVDFQVGRIWKACQSYGYDLIITADHGNADEMLTQNKNGLYEPKTSHSLNPVPFIISTTQTEYSVKEGDFGLANIAHTITDLLHIPGDLHWEESILTK